MGSSTEKEQAELAAVVGGLKDAFAAFADRTNRFFDELHGNVEFAGRQTAVARGRIQDGMLRMARLVAPEEFRGGHGSGTTPPSRVAKPPASSGTLPPRSAAERDELRAIAARVGAEEADG